jgi:hypothetical protein
LLLIYSVLCLQFGLKINTSYLLPDGKKFFAKIIEKDPNIKQTGDRFFNVSASTVRRLKTAFRKPKTNLRPKPIEKPSMKINLLRKRI